MPGRGPPMSDPSFVCAADALPGWRDDVLSGKPPVLFPVGAGELGRIEIGPGLVALLGGAPGAGKTAFTMQCAVDALRLTPTLRAVVCNVEMPRRGEGFTMGATVMEQFGKRLKQLREAA